MILLVGNADLGQIDDFTLNTNNYVSWAFFLFGLPQNFMSYELSCYLAS
jgi:hypothetical protein